MHNDIGKRGQYTELGEDGLGSGRFGDEYTVPGIVDGLAVLAVLAMTCFVEIP